jgi:hypothetical protein
LLGGRRSLGQGTVQAQAVADDNTSGGHRGAEVAGEGVDQVGQLVLVDGHEMSPVT